MTSLSIGLALTQGAPATSDPPPPAPISLITVDGIPTLENVVSGTAGITFTLAGTSIYAGDHLIDPTEQSLTASGPVNEVPPVLTGTHGTGNVLSCDGGLWAFDPDHGVPVYSLQWRRDGVDIAGATAQSYTQVTADADSVLSCVVTATQGVGARSAFSDTVSPPSSALLERVGTDFYSDNATGTTGSVTVDLSAYGAGDSVIVFTGPGEYVAQGNLSVDGVAATKVSTDQNGNTGARQSVFVHTLAGAGSAAAQIQTVNGTTHNFRAFAVYAVRGYALSAISTDLRNSGGADLSTALSVSAPTNAVLSCVVGLNWGTVTWSAVTGEETEVLSGETLGTALALNVPAGTIQPTVSTNVDGRAALVSILLETT